MYINDDKIFNSIVDKMLDLDESTNDYKVRQYIKLENYDPEKYSILLSVNKSGMNLILQVIEKITNKYNKVVTDFGDDNYTILIKDINL
jgi:dsDNA-binding SOS-regulon protein